MPSTSPRVLPAPGTQSERTPPRCPTVPTLLPSFCSGVGRQRFLTEMVEQGTITVTYIPTTWSARHNPYLHTAATYLGQSRGFL